jgi:DNA-binding transcriptional LysR family regulator
MVESVDLRRLQVLRVVHECGTVTAAAGLLHLTPSAVSHQLRQLSREVGVPLLERTGRLVRLTPAGLRLVGHADELHARWEQARADVGGAVEEECGALRMAGFPTAVAALLAPAAAQLREEHPRLEVHVSEVETVDGFGRLLAGEVDLAVVVPTFGTPPLNSRKFHQELLLEEPLDLLVPAGHRLAGAETVFLTEVARDPWVLAARGSCDFYELVQAACTAAGFNPEVVHHAKDVVAIFALVAHGLGVALTPRLTAVHPHPGVHRVSLGGTPQPSRRLTACVRRGSEDQPVIKRGLDALRVAASRCG